MDIHPVGAKLFHADGQTNGRTDITKLAPNIHGRLVTWLTVEKNFTVLIL